MATTTLTPAERRLREFLRFCTLLYGGAVVVFALGWQLMLQGLNAVAKVVSWPGQPIPVPNERFWLVLALSLMVSLTAMTYLAQRDVREHHILIQPILVSKLTSTVFFFLYFVLGGFSLAYLAGVATDGPLFIITFVLYRAARASVTAVAPVAASAKVTTAARR